LTAFLNEGARLAEYALYFRVTIPYEPTTNHGLTSPAPPEGLSDVN
jgi:hypothetical protein